MFRSCSVVLFLLLMFVAHGMGISIYNRNSILPDWEKSALVNLVQHYDEVVYDPSAENPKLSNHVNIFKNTNRLVCDFVDACCINKYININSGLYLHLLNMANNSIGRELIYRTMAKIIPRTECIASINKVLNYSEARYTEQEKLNVIGCFMQQLGIVAFNNTSDLLKAIVKDGECQTKINNLFNNPIVFHRRSVTVAVSNGHESHLNLIFKRIITRIKAYCTIFESVVRRMSFDLRLDPTKDDYFRGNIISIKGIASDVTFMSGPLLRTQFGLTAVGTKRENQAVEEILFHEFSHYFRMSLENKSSAGGLDVLKRRLFRRGFSERYLYFMKEIWTDAEELNAIIGLFASSEGNGLLYDYLNESEFNLCNDKCIRISHNSNHYTKVPYVLLLIIEQGREENVKEVSLDRKELPYEATSDVI